MTEEDAKLIQKAIHEGIVSAVLELVEMGLEIGERKFSDNTDRKISDELRKEVIANRVRRL